MAGFKLDIFETLRAIDKREMDFLDTKTAEERKGFAPLVVMRWASATGGDTTEMSLALVNSTVNEHFFDLGDHPELQYKLLASCGLGYALKHQWIEMPKRAFAGSKIYPFMLTIWPDASEKELNILLKQMDREDFRQLLDEHAILPKPAKELMDEYGRLIKTI